MRERSPRGETRTKLIRWKFLKQVNMLKEMVHTDTYQANIHIAKFLGWWEPKINSNGNIFPSREPISLLYVGFLCWSLPYKKEMEAETGSFKKEIFIYPINSYRFQYPEGKEHEQLQLKSPKQDRTVYIEPKCI